PRLGCGAPRGPARARGARVRAAGVGSARGGAAGGGGGRAEGAGRGGPRRAARPHPPGGRRPGATRPARPARARPPEPRGPGRRAGGAGPAVLKLLTERGLLRRFEQERREPAAVSPGDAPAYTPTAAQEAAFARIGAAIRERRFYPALLQGVTGSGKTEVYLR